MGLSLIEAARADGNLRICLSQQVENAGVALPVVDQYRALASGNSSCSAAFKTPQEKVVLAEGETHEV
jgi:hypothetical protein